MRTCEQEGNLMIGLIHPLVPFIPKMGVSGFSDERGARSAYEGVAIVQRDPSTCEILGQKPHFGKFHTSVQPPLAADHFQTENNFFPPRSLVPQISNDDAPRHLN